MASIQCQKHQHHFGEQHIKHFIKKSLLKQDKASSWQIMMSHKLVNLNIQDSSKNPQMSP